MQPGIAALIVIVPLFVFSAAAGLVIVRSAPSDVIAAEAKSNGRSLLLWEIRHTAGKWLYGIGDFLTGGEDSDAAHEESALARYFTLGSEARFLEQELIVEGGPDVGEKLEKAVNERQGLENKVERIIEGRVSEVLSREGLTVSPPLFDGIDFIFPPVDMEFDGPPHVLVISPRDKITLQRSYLLRNELSIFEIIRIEEEAESTGVAAFVDSIGGVATYPSTVSDRSSYRTSLSIAAHEWLHQYLFFKPLGRRYYESEEMRTINETVANIAGREIADLAEERFPRDAEPKQAAQLPNAEIGISAIMRDLRLAVDGLLAQGRVGDAEALMEERRLYLARNGIFIRKINQAFFAFRGTYADSPASSSPVGPKVQGIRDLTASVGEFVRAMAGVESVEDLDRLLSELSTQP